MKKGQALVEFIIILPIFLMLVLGVIDIGNIYVNKITLENEVSTVIDLFNSGKTEQEIVTNLDLNKKLVSLEIKQDEENVSFVLEKELDMVTPGLNLIFGNPYKLEVKRSINNDV